MNNAYVIGIAGGSASGKSTLAERLLSELSAHTVQVFHMDSYYKPEDSLPLVTTQNGREYRDYNCPDSFRMDELRKDLSDADVRFDIIIVEGLLTLWDEEICSRCDLRVYVDCPADIRIIRRIKRNLSWGLSFEEIADVYVDLVRKRHEEYVEPTKKKADVVIDSSRDVDRSLAELARRMSD